MMKSRNRISPSSASPSHTSITNANHIKVPNTEDNGAVSENNSSKIDQLQSIQESIMNKAYLSKSHENLTSGIRYRSNTGKSARSPRPLSWVGLNSDPVSYIPVPVKATPNSSTPNAKQARQVNFSGNDSKKTQRVSAVPLRAKSNQHNNSSMEISPLRKAVSVQNIKKASQSITRACSIDNLCRPTASSLQKNRTITKAQAHNHDIKSTSTPPSRLPINIARKRDHQSTSSSRDSPNNMKKSSSIQNLTTQSLNVLRRAQSSQNVSHGGRGRSLRNKTTTPSTALAYNAELLAIFEKEKRSLEGRISELVQITENRKAEIEKHKIEIRKLSSKIPSKSVEEEMEKLKDENKALRTRLEELGIVIDTLSVSRLEGDEDADGLSSNKPSSAVHMIASSKKSGGSSACLLDVTDGISLDLCGTPETPSELHGIDCSWERHSTRSSEGVSSDYHEVSVACLKEKIFRMEECQYSTNEELQATLQELGDLQRNVNQLAEENEQLGAERMVLLESLCTQTEKLENARTQIEHLKALILTDSDHTQSEKERELVNLLKIATEEREEFLLKQSEIHNALESFDQEYKDMQERVLSLTEKCRVTDEKRHTAEAERQSSESRLSECVEELANERIELERYKTLLENEKGKVLELQQLLEAESKTELEKLLENARDDKQKLEDKCADLQEALAHSRRELSKSKEQMQSLEQEHSKSKEKAEKLDQDLRTAWNNNKSSLSDMEFKYNKASADRSQLENSMIELRRDLDNQHKENNRVLEDNKNLRITVSDLQAELKGAKHRYVEFEKEMKALSQRHEEEASDWKQFQSDLQTAVVIANAIKAEAVEEKEQLEEKNKELIRKHDDLLRHCNLLQAELDRQKAQKGLGIFPTADLKKHLLGSDRELVALRQGRKHTDIKGNQNIVSVKALIKTIEGHGSLGSSTGSSRRGSSDSLGTPSTSSVTFAGHTTDCTRNSPERRISASEPLILKSALKKPKEEDKRPRSVYEKTTSPALEATSKRPSATTDKNVNSLLSIRSDSDLCNSEKAFDPLAKLVKQTGGSKRNALLKWCQQRTRGYLEVDVTNFSSSWNDGLAFCALLDNYIPEKIQYKQLLSCHDKKKNFAVAFDAAESVGISSTLDVDEMVSIERPDWQIVMSYVTSIYLHFEGD